MEQSTAKIYDIIKREEKIKIPEGESFFLNTVMTREELEKLKVLFFTRQMDLADMIEDDIVDEKDAMTEVYDLSWMLALLLSNLKKER